MFSGIVVEMGEVEEVFVDSLPGRLAVKCGRVAEGVNIGGSVCVNGVCLTVVRKENGVLFFELAGETIERTNLGSLMEGSRVNLENSLALGDTIDGHLVFGHIDCCVKLLEREEAEVAERYFWEYPARYRGMIVEKGSVALNGISLTVGEVTGEGFATYIIPHTSEVTNISLVKIGEEVNLEIDMLARYVKGLTEAYMGGTGRIKNN